ncbi:uncharacterized protein HaLaN_28862, partial [Haematococcus lacustris]
LVNLRLIAHRGHLQSLHVCHRVTLCELHQLTCPTCRPAITHTMTLTAPVLVQTLKDLCIRVVAASFENNPQFGPLSEKYIKKVTSVLPLDLPLELVG